MNTITGGVVAPLGFKAAGVHCGIKRKRNDVALIVSDRDSVAAGVFTQNVVKAHCVLANQERLPTRTARGIVVNSGNANACNGEQGSLDNTRMLELAAQQLSVDPMQLFSASTGIIGVNMPMDRLEAGIKDASTQLDSKSSAAVSEAIMTTDTFEKEFAVEFELGGGIMARIGAIAKGSGMIAPNMATMLSFVTTDAAIDQLVLQEMVNRCVWYTFNSITVDGDTSTNDMVLVLANGAAGNKEISSVGSQDGAIFETALYNVCMFLAKEIARDGEGATKLIGVGVRNVAPPENLVQAYASSGTDLTREQRASFARSIAKTVANSPLVKTALFGNDPNWGRILAAVGRSGVKFDPSIVDITLAGHLVFHGGKPTDFDHDQVAESLKKSKEVAIVVDLHQTGGEDATVWTCDFSYDYVKINAEYHT